MNLTAEYEDSMLHMLGPVGGRARVEQLQAEMLKHAQYEPTTRHYFHGGMYCREVFRDADVTIVGKVHRKEHFYVVASGTVLITDGINPPREVVGPAVLVSFPGTKRAVYAVTPATCMTFHVCDAATIEAAEAELVEPDETSPFLVGNVLKKEVIK